MMSFCSEKDVLLFGKRSLFEWNGYKDILDLFNNAIGMAFNESKSCFLAHEVEEDSLVDIKAIFPFEVQKLTNGFKYLGYFLKPNNYKVGDWRWLVRKVEKRIG